GVRALVIGAGPIGLGVMAMAAASGSEVAAMDVNADRLAFAKSWAKSVHTVLATESSKERLLEWNDGELPSVVIDATGNLRSMTDAFGLVGYGDSLVYVGLVNSDITINDPDFHARELTLMSSRNATREEWKWGTGMKSLSQTVTFPRLAIPLD
ncbi:zinc-binding dehydrogenase, partial [Paenibacillus sp. p3-SID867]|uniref:zinc-binding dehydrogenase n=1 Tax=Paenibacillus sp. p3-SID867 TaxID=2916363 RepID=UPI0021A2DA37